MYEGVSHDVHTADTLEAEVDAGLQELQQCLFVELAELAAKHTAPA